MSENYIIKKETLTATADAIRSHIGSTPAFKSEVTGEDNMLATEVNVYYVEYIDEILGGYGLNEGADGTDAFIAYGYLADNNGIITPVLYKTDIYTEYQDPDYYEPFFYVGQTQIDGVDYDKWRKIELGDENGTEGEITWESEAKKYIYTDVVVDSDAISPLEFPNKIDDVYNKGLSQGAGNSLDTSDATAVADDILDGKTAYVDGEKVVGSIPVHDNLVIMPQSGINNHSVYFYQPFDKGYYPEDFEVKGGVSLNGYAKLSFTSDQLSVNVTNKTTGGLVMSIYYPCLNASYELTGTSKTITPPTTSLTVNDVVCDVYVTCYIHSSNKTVTVNTSESSGILNIVGSGSGPMICFKLDPWQTEHTLRLEVS